MFRTLSIFGLLTMCFTLANAQSPSAFNYQAVARASNGELITDQSISVLVGIVQEDINGSTIYEEIHQVTTTALGVINLTIGEGGNQLGELSEVKWASCPHFLRIEIDFTDNGNFELMSIAQLLSVPYSMYANNATSATVADSTWKAAQAVFAESANNAESAAFAEQADEANFAQSALNATQANFAENATNAVNAQFATTASFAEEAANTFWRPNDQAIFYSKGTVGLLPATADFEPIFKGRLTVIGNDEQDDNIPTWLINDDSNEIFGQTGLGRILRMKKSADEDYSIGTYDWGIDNNQSLYLQTPSGKGGFTYNPNFIIDGTNRFIGIDTASPKAKLHVAEGDIYIENVGSGVIMKDNNNGCWRLTIDAIGRIQTTQLESCPEE